MKKVYETPAVEKVAFQYRDQVVVASGACGSQWLNDAPPGGVGCTIGTPEKVQVYN